MYKTTTWI